MLSLLVSVVVVPPVNLAVLAVLALLLPWSGLGRLLALASLLLLLLLGLPLVSGTLLAGLEAGLPAAGASPAAAPGAIVILGGDEVPAWPPLDATVGVARDIGPLSLERLRGGAALQRATRLPVLITGGVLAEGSAPVAVLMARSLVADFRVPVRWIEPAARDTWDNARLSAAILRPAGIGTVYVVTHAWHMRRALIAFAAAGLVAVPAPLALDRPPHWSLGDFVPRPVSWERSYFALHEWLGAAWYAWRRARG